MVRETIAKILESAGGKGSKSVALPEAVELTALITTEGDVLSIPRVVRVDFAEQFVTFETGKGERCFFAYENVLGFRAADATAGKDRGAGFGR